ncbi:hypothetical protein [Acetobacter sp.]|jgi:hypothetical protein|uniref:hypothetical protein n=1 Tax=Acetobacter sp. TaxID=440 RepID=UPI0025BA5643|nr:hypothetical protein [Acetobacter sp.]MCH4091437.1 hypothetical protein [Acetobacter sp.]MCI1299415.1 hypothetical protein [Acetobacter sp.]MCI1316995.1 hypothetical protein [Acetobacter sp.]
MAQIVGLLTACDIQRIETVHIQDEDDRRDPETASLTERDPHHPVRTWTEAQ